MQISNPNQTTLKTQTTQEIQRLRREFAMASRRMRAEQGLFAEDIAILSGGLITTPKLDRIELERLQHLHLEVIVSLALVLNHRVKITFEPMTPETLPSR